MIKIAICDDEKYMVDDIGIRIMDYFNDDKELFELFEFSNGSDFLSFYNEEGKTDIIFMDIEVGDDNGIEIISKIREIDENVIVIFVTSHPSFIKYSFMVKAFQYIHKPIDQLFFNDEFDRAVNDYNKRFVKITMRFNGKDTYLNIRDITHIESINKKTIFYFNDGITQESPITLSNILIKFKDYEFVQIHKSYIVNLAKVESKSMTAVYLGTNIEIPISRKYKDDFLKRLNLYLNGVALW